MLTFLQKYSLDDSKIIWQNFGNILPAALLYWGYGKVRRLQKTENLQTICSFKRSGSDIE